MGANSMWTKPSRRRKRKSSNAQPTRSPAKNAGRPPIPDIPDIQPLKQPAKRKSPTQEVESDEARPPRVRQQAERQEIEAPAISKRLRTRDNPPRKQRESLGNDNLNDNRASSRSRPEEQHELHRIPKQRTLNTQSERQGSVALAREASEFSDTQKQLVKAADALVSQFKQTATSRASALDLERDLRAEAVRLETIIASKNRLLGDTSRQKDQLQKSLETLKTEIGEMEKRVAEDQATKEALHQSNDALENDISGLKSELKALKDKVTDFERKAQAQNEKVASTQADLVTVMKVMAGASWRSVEEPEPDENMAFDVDVVSKDQGRRVRFRLAFRGEVCDYRYKEITVPDSVRVQKYLTEDIEFPMDDAPVFFAKIQQLVFGVGRKEGSEGKAQKSLGDKDYSASTRFRSKETKLEASPDPHIED